MFKDVTSVYVRYLEGSAGGGADRRSWSDCGICWRPVAPGAATVELPNARVAHEGCGRAYYDLYGMRWDNDPNKQAAAEKLAKADPSYAPVMAR